jgi:hypothetical protein
MHSYLIRKEGQVFGNDREVNLGTIDIPSTIEHGKSSGVVHTNAVCRWKFNNMIDRKQTTEKLRLHGRARGRSSELAFCSYSLPHHAYGGGSASRYQLKAVIESPYAIDASKMSYRGI